MAVVGASCVEPRWTSFRKLWSVLRAEMSLARPTPALPGAMDGWGDELHQRLGVPPGITGMAGQRTDNASFDDYERLDLYDVDNWSLVSDLTILVRTTPVSSVQ